MNWLLITTESNPDRWFQKYVTTEHLGFSVAVISDQEKVLWVHELDCANVAMSNFDLRIFQSKSDLINQLSRYISQKGISDIKINYSTVGDESVNTLSHGLYINFIKPIELAMGKQFSSAENLIYEQVCRLNPDQIERMKKLASRTDQLIRKVLQSIKPGETERQIHTRLQMLATKTYEQTDFYKAGVTEELAWDSAGCPIVLSGKNIAKPGHTQVSDKIIKEGEVVYIDFGLRHTYPDQKVVNSDLQRACFLKNDDNSLFVEIQKRFEVVRQSIVAGFDIIKPGIRGSAVDEAVRSVITKSDYPDYNHATGHSIGEQVHDVGALISNNSERGKLKVMSDVVYTIEPRIQMVNGISIEEMVLVTDDKVEFICKPQEELIVIQ